MALHVRVTTARRIARVWAALVMLGLAILAAQLSVNATRAVRVPIHPTLAADEGDQRPASVVAAFALPQGATGTTVLPPLPHGAILLPAETGIVPARPFSIARLPAQDRGRALQGLTAAIYYEAASESDAGQQAVAQVVLNRVRHPAFPATVCGVVYQGSESRGCQFSFACDGAMSRIPAAAAWSRAARAAAAALAGRVYAGVSLATHYHTYAVTPAWNRTLVMTDVVGAHFFHRWKGWWGTAPAFRQAYQGGEPEPGPHMSPPLAPLPIAPVVPPVVAAVTVPLVAVQPAHAESGASLVPPVPQTDALPAASQVLDRWKDSGQPLR